MMKKHDVDVPITMWYQCEITNMPTDNTHCLACVSFKEKKDIDEIERTTIV